MSLIPTLPPLAHPILMTRERTGELLRAPVGMGIPSFDELRTSSNCLWRSMGLDQMLYLIKGVGSQLKRLLRTHGRPRFSGDDHDLYKPFSFLEQIIQAPLFLLNSFPLSFLASV
jgi:hypothetical protein